jgi:hypothetical protein
MFRRKGQLLIYSRTLTQEENKMDIEQLAIQAGVIDITNNSIYWTENNAIEVLDKFAQLVIQAYKEE